MDKPLGVLAAYSPLISIVVPVYNVERYLSQCVHSILDQTYDAIEILLVDDGSSDGSESMCDRFADMYERVVSLHKQNGGLADARNFGVLHSSGEYVLFVDSDDVISPVYVEAFVDAIRETDCDMSAFEQCKLFVDDSNIGLCKTIEDVRAHGPYDKISAEEYIERILYHRSETGACCRIYRRELVASNPFPVGMIFEDAAVVYRIVHQCESVAVIPSNELYGYRQRSGSIMNSGVTEAMVISAISIGRQVESDIKAWYPKSAAAASCGFSINRVVLLRTRKTDHRYREMLWNEILSYRNALLLDKKARPVKRFAAAVTFLGKSVFLLASTVFENLRKAKLRRSE